MPTTVSVIIPAYNAEKFLSDALESIKNQSYPVQEIIVVDDGSTDGTAELVKNYPYVTYVYQHNQGTATALNTAVTKARGNIFAFLDADDVWLPDKLLKQIAVMHTDESVELVFTNLQNSICSTLADEQRERIEWNDKPMQGVHKSTLVIRRNAFFSAGYFSTNASIDLLDWYARVKEKGLKEHMIEEVLVKRRIHGNNQTLVKKKIATEFPAILKQILDRRRSAQ
jgi:glycosyltransferase involved in cell wall biosynthesis